MDSEEVNGLRVTMRLKSFVEVKVLDQMNWPEKKWWLELIVYC